MTDIIKEALEATRIFLLAEYSCAESQALRGEVVAPEAVNIWHKVCDALAVHETNQKRIAELEAALEPFRLHAKERVVFDPAWGDNTWIDIIVHISDLRRAYATLNHKETEE